MRFDSIKAVANPVGNRIDLTWAFPQTPAFPGVRVVRRERSHPTNPDDGVVVAHGEGIVSAVDRELKGGTVYYYALFGYRDDPPVYDVEPGNRAASLATSSYDYAGQMYDLLPGVYHRYDTQTCDDSRLSEADRARGQLRRFLDLPGGLFDLLHSYSSAALDLHDVQCVHGALLPLLAHWIGWRTDNLVETETQRNEVRHAPCLYRTIGLVATMEATVKRITGWESRTKEFVHNVFRSNAPERLTLWIQQREGGAWDAPFLLSTDHAYEGRPVAARDSADALWLLYQTYSNGHLQIWYKRYDAASGWTPSQPLPSAGTMNKYPALAMKGPMPWAIWAAFDDAKQRWSLVESAWNGTVWSTAALLPMPVNGTCQPAATMDGANNVWLFWLERSAGGTRVRYSRNDGTSWAAPLTFPPDGGADPAVEADLFVICDQASSRLWVFWARQTVISGNQTRWEVAYRVKGDVSMDAANWSAVHTLPQPGGAQYSDRQPAARIDAGTIELYWTSNRSTQGYSLWSSRLIDEGANAWDAASEITSGPYTQRDPLPIAVGTDIWLIYRSNRSIAYQSDVYQATQLADFRYAGSTTADPRHAAKLALRGEFDDFQTYTYDTGTNGKRDDRNRYARDTAGIYLAPDTLDAARVESGIERARTVLAEFMPITDRVVFVSHTEHHDDYVYTYGASGAEEPYFITASYTDLLTTVATEQALPLGEDFFDSMG